MTLAYHPALTSPIRVPDPEPRRIPAVDIQRAVCRHYGFNRNDLIGKRQTRALTQARQLAMYLVRSLTSLSFGQIGVVFGGKDHSTVIHAYGAVTARLALDPTARADHDAIVEALKG